jgi:hypothetical protein
MPLETGVHDGTGELAIENERTRESAKRCIEESGANVLGRSELGVGTPAAIARESSIGRREAGGVGQRIG